MDPSLSFASVKHNFSNGISLGENFLDEETWNSFSPGAQTALLELSKTSVAYTDSAIKTAISGDNGFLYSWKETIIKALQQENIENEIIDRENEKKSLQYL